MEDVAGYRFFSCRPAIKYLPKPPPTPPKLATEYDRLVQLAPHLALSSEITTGGFEVERQPVFGRRVRSQTGLTNRWRLPEALGADLLGSSQALKALSTPLNDNLIRLITAEGPKAPLCYDLSKPYRFRVTNDRFRKLASEEEKSLRCLETSTRPSSGRSLKEALDGSFRRLHASIRHGGIPPARLDRARPQDVYACLTQRYAVHNYPDAVLHCLGLRWLLHEAFIRKSDVLTDLYIKGKLEKFPLPPKDICDDKENPLTMREVHRRCHYDCSDIPPINLCLEDLDPMVTPNAMAVALGNLYCDDFQLMTGDIAGVLVASHAILFKRLEDSCVELMIHNLNWETICRFYLAATKCSRADLEEACESWLELNLVPQLSSHVEVGQLPVEGLLKVLKSPRLFTYDEFCLYKTLASWLFLQLNPQLKELPPYSMIMAHFNSFSKSCSVLEREEGLVYADVFVSLRLHGIIDMTQIHDIQMMNVLPLSWINKLVTGHYNSLMSGGDMSAMMNFDFDAIRRGFIILTCNEPYERTELVAIYGFFFLLKATRKEGTGNYSFWIERLKPSDPVLTIKEKERETFSTRPDRDVEYSILIQHYDDNAKVVRRTTGRQKQRFGLGHRTSCGKVFEWNNLRQPLYVSFFLYLRPS